MKINKIRFANIHSLKGEHEIDFGSGVLAEAGLFAITGPTGSGKSTLLDVITLALFNRIPRIDKNISKSVIDDLGGIMTRNAKHCFAEVEFSVNGLSYRSYWSIEKNRNNNLNSRKQELVALPSGDIITEGKKTPEDNEKIIGLNYDQFVKAMVLSQGEFSKLLKAPRDERNKLLEHITGAKSYRKIGQAVFQRFSLAKRQVEDQQLKMEDVSLLSPEQHEDIKKDLSQLNADSSKVEKAYNIAKTNIEAFDTYQKKKENLIEKEKEQNTFQVDLKTFEPVKTTLSKHNKLVVHKELLFQLKTNTANYKNISEAIEVLKQQNKSCLTKKEAYTEDVIQLIKEPITDATINSKLEHFRIKVSELMEIERSSRKEADFISKDVMSKRIQLMELGIAVPEFANPDTCSTLTLQLQQKFQKEIESSGLNNLEGLKTEVETFRTKEKALIKLISDIKSYTALQEAFIRKKAEIVKAKTETKVCDANTEALNKEIQILEKEIKELSEKVALQSKQKSLVAHRHELVDNKPCPLCGAKEHPYAIAEPLMDVEEAHLNTKKELFQTKNDLQIKTIANRKHLQDTVERSTLEIKETEKQSEVQLAHIYSESDRLDFKRSTDVNTFYEFERQLQGSIKVLEKSEIAFRAIDQCKAILETNANWKATIDKLAITSKKRLALYQGVDIDMTVQKLQNTITETTTELKSIGEQIASQIEALKSEEIKKTTSENAIKVVLVEEKLSDIAKLENAILDESEAEKIREQERGFEKRRLEIENSVKHIKKELEALALKVDHKLQKPALQAHFEQSKIAWEGLSKKIWELNNRVKQNALVLKKMEADLKVLEGLKKELSLWRSMNTLIGDATGKKFSNFVQDLTLEQLIGYANRRLEELSDRYILDIPTADESEKNDTLKVFDVYMGNARRSVNTLSGGETFMVSLAMAFALSDLASKNVNIESLFIDEGFGTLDPDTLDQAITILEKMQNEGDKSIGVISHVEALKERITTQVQLEKSSLGHSTINILQ